LGLRLDEFSEGASSLAAIKIRAVDGLPVDTLVVGCAIVRGADHVVVGCPRRLSDTLRFAARLEPKVVSLAAGAPVHVDAVAPTAASWRRSSRAKAS
jgi:hypothetical protein